MGQISVSVNSQNYTLACRDGEEERLRDLTRQVDEKARDLSQKLGQVGEARLLLMVSLLLADELRDLREQGPGQERDWAAAKLLDDAALEIEGIVERLQSA
ncbi:MULTISPECIES: cell division protein ZapA [unclassified Iodidimonas]|jgi:cell division protein ZapA|uniref:cell division protein ZapA n=1 Tax=unclassified Iodidimonas TaxID=2626145 RepID=UPI00248275CC|nr:MULTISPECIES: cell division protein ZapA [unclassified Iodidimonas]